MVGVPSPPRSSGDAVRHSVGDRHREANLRQERAGGIPSPPKAVKQLTAREGRTQANSERVTASRQVDEPACLPPEGAQGPLPDFGVVFTETTGLLVGGRQSFEGCNMLRLGRLDRSKDVTMVSLTGAGACMGETGTLLGPAHSMGIEAPPEPLGNGPRVNVHRCASRLARNTPVGARHSGGT